MKLAACLHHSSQGVLLFLRKGMQDRIEHPHSFEVDS